MIQVKEIRQIGEWGKSYKKGTTSFVSKWEIIKTLEEGVNEFLESINGSMDRFIDVKYQAVQTQDWQETIALIIYSTLKPKEEKS